MTELRQWIDESLERFQVLLGERLPSESPSRFRDGFWTAGYKIRQAQRLDSLRELVRLLSEAQGKETGWPAWWVPARPEIAPYPFKDTVECWLGELTAGPDDSDFWRTSPEGLTFLLRGYQDDASERVTPGSMLDPILPIWRCGECFLHAMRLSDLWGVASAEIEIEFSWTGLQGRTLREWANRGGERYFLKEGVSRTPDVTSRSVFTGTQVRESLPKLVMKATSPLFEAFDFAIPGSGVYEAEIERLVDKTKRR